MRGKGHLCPLQSRMHGHVGSFGGGRSACTTIGSFRTQTCAFFGPRFDRARDQLETGSPPGPGTGGGLAAGRMSALTICSGTIQFWLGMQKELSSSFTRKSASARKQAKKWTLRKVIARYPQWRPQLEVLLECHRRLVEPLGTPPTFPAPGDTFAGFSILAELGRGAEGRVFLATQPSLADRPIVLKLTPMGGQEHLSLARLQHTSHHAALLGPGRTQPELAGLVHALLRRVYPGPRSRPAEGHPARFAYGPAIA